MAQLGNGQDFPCKRVFKSLIFTERLVMPKEWAGQHLTLARCSIHECQQSRFHKKQAP